MIKPNIKIEPLREDLDKILDSEFLVSTAFKRWLVEIGFAERWNQCISIAKDNLKGVLIMGSNKEMYAHAAFTLALNYFYEKSSFDNLLTFIVGALKTYCDEKKTAINLEEIKKDLRVAGVDKENIDKLDFVNSAKESSGVEIESESDKVRALEKKYNDLADSAGVNSSQAIHAYLDWHAAAVVYLNQFYSPAHADFQRLKDLDNSGNGFSLKDNYHSIRSIYNLLMNNAVKSSPLLSDRKTPMVFISHSSKDREFVEALVDLLEAIGLDQSNVFCSSVDGYGVGLGNNIFDTLRNLYIEHELYVLFVHSPRYYQSHVSLNEMGAAWVLHTKHQSFLTQDMTFDKMTGVINGQELSLKVDSDNAASLLIQLKNSLIGFFSLQPVDEQKWERKSRVFLNSVRNIKVAVENKQGVADLDAEFRRLQVEKLRQEAEDRKKAVIRGNIIRGVKAGTRELKLYNAGKCEAKNVKVEWLNQSDQVLVMNDFSDIGDLTPQNSRTFHMALCMGAPEIMNLRYSWKDEYSDNNTYIENIQL